MLLSYTLNGHSTKYQCFIDLLEAVSVTACSIEVYHNDLMRKERYRTSFWKQVCGASLLPWEIELVPRRTVVDAQ
jgi:hypothetical protein